MQITNIFSFTCVYALLSIINASSEKMQNTSIVQVRTSKIQALYQIPYPGIERGRRWWSWLDFGGRDAWRWGSRWQVGGGGDGGGAAMETVVVAEEMAVVAGETVG
jgi:hypothetical protein